MGQVFLKMMRRCGGPVGAVAGVLFPATCWAGGGEAGLGGGLSESATMGIAELAAQNYCRRCGLGTGAYAVNDFANPCGRCVQRECGVRRYARVGTFSEPLIKLIHGLKFGAYWEVAEVVSPFLRHAISRVAEEGGVRVDGLIPVPLHWLRRARRGFNQAEELARQAGKFDGWPVWNVLRRVRRTSEQARIASPASRAENVRGAFVCARDKRVAGKHVWIVDDVSTTGATIHAAARALLALPRAWRPASINAATLCVTDHEAPVVGMDAACR